MKKSVLQNIKSAFNLSYLALIVLFCFAISTSFMSINYVAKYLSTDGGFDGTRVALFHSNASYEEKETIWMDMLTKDLEDTYTFSVSTNSETAVQHKIKVVLSKPLPEWITLVVGYDNIEKTEQCSSEKVEYIFDGGKINANDNVIKDYTLTIKAKNYYNTSQNDSQNNILDVSFNVYVITEQID